MISVIVPTHNRLELLQKKLAALEGQLGDFEVIVVADGCTDATPGFLNSHTPPYPFKAIYTDGNGPAFARNRGAEAARGEILLFSDDDVVPGPDWVAAHRAAHPSPNTVAVGRLVLPPGLRGCGAAELPGPGLFWWNVTGNNTSLSKALFNQSGGYDESFVPYGGEDPDLGYRLTKLGAKLHFVSEAEATHEAWDYPPQALKKARQAGAAHVRVWLKHRDPKIAWALGVHPAMLAVKMALIPGFKFLWGTKGDGELAYAWGAWEAYEARKTTHA